MKKVILFALLVILVLFMLSCNLFYKDIKTEEDLLEIYTISTHVTDIDYRKKVIKKYNVENKERWEMYRELILELAKDPEKFIEFKKKSIDKYISERNNDYLIKYYRVGKAYNKNFRPTNVTKELTEEDFKIDKAYKIFFTIGKHDRMKTFILEYYVDGELEKRLYINELSKAIKEEIIKNNEIKSTIYINIE